MLELRKTLTLAGWILVFYLILLTLGFGLHRIYDVTEHGLLHPTQESDWFDSRYRLNPGATWLHIAPGAIFVVLGPWQFMRPVRSRYLKLHRWMGRVFIASGALAGASSMLLALRLPAYGGVLETSATFVFGPLLLFCLFKAYRHIKRRDIARHREWMIRSFSIGLGVAMIRQYLLLASMAISGDVFVYFGEAFWLGLASSAAAGELWVRYTRASRRKAR